MRNIGKGFDRAQFGLERHQRDTRYVFITVSGTLLYRSINTLISFTSRTAAYIQADPLELLVTGNAYYANKATSKNPDAFVILSQGQTPQILWIGCADSRIPETTVCHCKPGDIFVHRNIANTIHADDINAASVVEYAVTHLKVAKVVVCGHTKCGGAIASLTDADLGETLNKWLHPLRQ